MNKILSTLESIAGKKTFAGQHCAWALDGTQNGYERNCTGLLDLTGRLPTILGVEFGIHLSQDNLDAVLPLLLDWHGDNGIIQIDFHSSNPWTGGPYSDTTRGPLSELYTPGTVQDTWHATLDQVAYALAVLRDANVPVLWRPFHEAAYNDVFWWATRTEFDEFKRAWWDMYSYLCGEHNLDNLVWVYAAANTDNWMSVLEHYPGSKFVDVVGIDVYSDTMTIRGDGYNRMLGTGKAFAFTECGPGNKLDGSFDATIIVEAIETNYPETVYFHAWHSDTWRDDPALWKRRALVDLARINYLMSDSRIVTLYD